LAVTAVVVASPAPPRSSTLSSQDVSFDQTDATASTCGPLAHLLGVCRTTTTTTSPSPTGTGAAASGSTTTIGSSPSTTSTTSAPNSAAATPATPATPAPSNISHAYDTPGASAPVNPNSAAGKPCKHGGPPIAAPSGTWTCTLDDEFNGTALDARAWAPQLTQFSGYTTGTTKPCYVNNPQTINESGGTLNVSVIRLPKMAYCKGLNYFGSTSRYEAGMVTSYKLFSQQYGFFEVRAETPSTTMSGLQETLWLYPSDETLYGKWPDSGEIDFAEFYSDLASKDYPILHFPGATHDPNSKVVPNGCAAASATPGGQFNTYGVLWTPTTITTYFNGVPCFTDAYGSYVTNPDSAPEPFNQPFFLNFTAALGMGLNAVNMHTPMPATTKIDWVRVWQYG
jgi:beta-glucanase (GH16 family)